ncbi:CHAD domain-containing protein [Cellulomonas fengjieae]|uniref:CHAD domain-containing protein n=1 Tax=Cellulomonas fengjieae TaxID=2819978 RepID=A0ABS3SDY3_9CELL|nr:CHAD domain-containing protein [Cellulomonas fengjieae]MBO3083963.1 CHAD domain-containing protein [Cellulomonas fengjieae]QVI64767.1 CHAD domain-containing protein [Cellulomonas fengjieae]
MGTAGEVVQEYVTVQVERLLGAVPALRSGDDDAVHDARVATRRLRAALSVYRPVLDRSGCDPVRDQLTELGHVLGDARDAHVERRALEDRLTLEDPATVVGPVEQRIQEDRAAARLLAQDRLEAWLTSPRFEALAAALSQPLPAGPRAGRAAAGYLPRRARRAWERLDDAVAVAAQVVPGNERDEALHEVRKAARRARYASEVVEAVVGEPARRSAARAHRVQEVLGDLHDTVVRRETLRRLAHLADLDGESTFTYGRLHALEQAAGDAAESAAERPVRRATRWGHRRWMS